MLLLKCRVIIFIVLIIYDYIEATNFIMYDINKTNKNVYLLCFNKDGFLH